ncbi:DinB family protein [Amycolatopsis sp. ATCC 39116]|uniref:DinB family protein n=1 Tax=Amycolatopsis sp. (strain ATCC 39116 / 75iv2) TaxID=385957 RepID=UPI000311DF29|nr:DinB family protein [Amycolatopsis sp. ATCC 39116]
MSLLRWQFDLTWSLADLHLSALTPADFRWEPGPLTWHVREAGDGWTIDWADTEPDPVPVPTIAWIAWHVGWWWSVTLNHAHGRRPRERESVGWPGDENAVAWLRELAADWGGVLDRLSDPDAPAAFPWPAEAGLTVAHQAAWVNAELMKNAAEIGQLRLLRAAQATSG